MSKANRKNHSSGGASHKSHGCKKISVCGNTRIEYISNDDEHGCCKGKSPKAATTKIVAEVDIGFGNTLYIRGAGCGLNWENGIALKNQDANFWVFEVPSCKEDFEYKLLINDEIWSTGENFVAYRGMNNIVSPKF